MEFFLPSLFIFLLAVIVISFVVPRMSPMIIIGMSAVLLGFGVYHHFKLFWNDYKQSTWQDQLRLFAPGIMLTVIIIYVLFSLLMFFTGGSVPVPPMPKVELPPANTATNFVTETINNIISPIMPNNTTPKSNNTTRVNEASTANNKNKGNQGNQGNQANQGNQNKGNQSKPANQNNTAKANRGNELSRSFLATI
jgi:hypothetical protein